LITNKTVCVKVSLIQNIENGLIVFSETHYPSTNTNGLMSFSIGSGAKISGDLSTVDWSKGPYFIKTEVDFNGGSNYSISTVSQLLSVPYALYAANSQPGPKGEKGDGLIDGSTKNQMLYWNGLNWVTINPGNPGEVLTILNDEIKWARPNGFGQPIKDIDGNYYKTVYIGGQLWMAENLRTTKFNDGTKVPFVTSIDGWKNNFNPACVSFQNDSVGFNVYGTLYNWYTVNLNKNICPIGWHVPSKNDLYLLSSYLGGNEIAGGQMKDVGSIVWNSPNTGATNSSFFCGIPGGARFNNGEYKYLGLLGIWWSSTEFDSSDGLVFRLQSFDARLDYVHGNKGHGYSIRCIKD
jgi:uncharacterized protein (TIGR02145 family)